MGYRIEIPDFGQIEAMDPMPGLDYRVLLVDDEEDWTSTTAQLLESKGISSVDIAPSLEKADILVENDGYDAVLFDIVLDESSRGRGESLQGDDWYLERLADRNYPLCVAVTGHYGKIRAPQEVKARGARIVRKGSSAESELYEELASLARRKKEEILDLIGSILRGERMQRIEARGGRSITDRVSEEAEGLFLEWLRSRKDQESPVLWMGDENFSVSDLALDVERRQPRGTMVLEAFVRHLRNLLRLTQVN